MKPKLECCPCGGHKAFLDCCGHYLDGAELPATAEILMRSRYTAYTLKREDYLLRTWHCSTRPASLGLTDQSYDQWLGLTVKRYEQSTPVDAIVEFVACYIVGGRAYRLHEISRFVYENGRWFYVDGDII